MVIEKDVFKEVIENFIPLHQFLGVKLVEISKGFAKIKIPFRPELIGDPRIQSLHGGIISLALDSVGGAAAMTTLVSPDDRLSTIDIRVDYLRPGKPKDLFAEGELARSGNRIIVTRMVAYHEKTEPIAEGKGVYNVRRKID
ncbi:MAG TPA: hotdog fold thioesterase [Chitinophagales bacterium]|nr:hotdog fold thioesterase [Chitinophagales bacterium]